MLTPTTEAAILQDMNIDFDGHKMKTRLGEITIYEKNLITFPDGLFGFEHAHHFVLANVPGTDEDTNFTLMQSLEYNDLCFVVFNASLKQKLDSKNNMSAVDMQTMYAELRKFDIDPDAHGIGFIVSIIKDEISTQITLNASAPLIFNDESNQGFQIVLNNPAFTVNHKIFG